jgi:SAM-dependent methyltransferase
VQEDVVQGLTSRYDREAEAYRELWAPVLLASGRKLLGHFDTAAVRRAVDVGAGVGVLLPEIQRAWPDAMVYGCDRSAGMISRAPEDFCRYVMDARALAIAGASVDVVTMVFMLFHLQEPIEGLREARRMLRDGGQVGIVTWGVQRDSDAEVVWARCLDHFGAPPSDTLNQSRHDLVDSPEKMKGLLTEAGFTDVRSWTERLRCADDLDHFIRIKTSMGHTKGRYDALDAGAQKAFIAEARRRLDAPDFASVSEIVYSVARPRV